MATEHKSGNAIIFTSSASSGSSENHYGNGSVDIYLHRPGSDYVWLDLGEINYTDSSSSMIKEMEAAKPYSQAANELPVHRRRLSRKQASYIQKEISNFLEERFQGVIPSDAEIVELEKKIAK